MKRMIRYRRIPNHPGYVAGSDGSVWSCWIRGQGTYWTIGPKRVRRLKPSSTPTGHQVVVLAGRKGCIVHRLILETFIGPCPKKMECCHDDGNPKNNRLTNLRWDTKLNNMQDRKRHGVTSGAKGENNSGAKITKNKVMKIREQRAKGMTLTTIASLYGLTPSTISKIARGQSWKHLLQH